MNEQPLSTRNEWDCKVIGAAIAQTAKLLGPFIKDDKLQAEISGIEMPQRLKSWYPVSILIQLFDIAIELGVMEQLV